MWKCERMRSAVLAFVGFSPFAEMCVVRSLTPHDDFLVESLCSQPYKFVGRHLLIARTMRLLVTYDKLVYQEQSPTVGRLAE
jgi:hypothetical protein